MTRPASLILSWNATDETYSLFNPEKPCEIWLPGKEGEWLEWLGSHKSFIFQGKNGRLNLQKETRPRSQDGYWYAYRRQAKRMVKQYLGRSSEVTTARLENAAQVLASKAPTQEGEGVTGPQVVSLTTISGPENVKSNEEKSGATGLLQTPVLAEKTSLVLPVAEPLLELKLRLPRLHSSLLPRSRLLGRLNEGLERKLTLILAPAGFGKTTLVRQWLAERFEVYPLPQGEIPKIAWVSLDPGDNDPVRFWRYILVACQSSGLANGQTALEQLTTPPQPPYHPLSLHSVLVSFLNELAHVPSASPNILVLEDYHVITATQIHESLAFFLENLPPNLHLLIMTRHDPPLPLARLRGQGELNELYQADLRFSVEETWNFLQANNSYQFSEETVRQLDQHLEGWAAGLRLLILALQRLQSQLKIEQFLKTFAGSHRPIQEYFVSEVLNLLPDQLQNFILQTSILERLTPSLCNALTGESESSRLLETLERRNLFLETLAGSDTSAGEWYRYHTLFAEAMQQELVRSQGEAALTGLYNRASRWFEQNGLLPDAVEAAIKAREYERAANLVEKLVDDTYSLAQRFFEERNEFYTMTRWLKELPTAILRQHPLLCLSFASALFYITIIEFSTLSIVEFSTLIPVDMPPVREMLEWSEEGWRATNQTDQLAQVFAYRSLLANMLDNVEEAVDWAWQALDVLPEEEQQWRGVVLNVLGSYEFYYGRLDRAKRYFNEICEAQLKDNDTGNRNFWRANMDLLAWVYTHQGKLNQAAEYANLVLAEARTINDVDDITRSLIILAGLAYERNDLETAWQHSQEVLTLLPQANANYTAIEATLLQAQILYAQGQPDQAHQRLSKLLNAVQLQESLVGYQLYRESRLYQARFFLDNGNLAGFEQWVNWRNSDEALPTGKDFKIYLVQQTNEVLLLARWLIGQGKWVKAMALLEPLLAEVEAASRFHYSLKIKLTMAQALAAGKRLAEARQLVLSVFSQAQVEGFVRLFLDEGKPLANLLRATPLPGNGTTLNRYRQQILLAFDQNSPASLPATIPEPLSPQEHRVLTLLKTGLSYPEIARELVVSVNTVKTQVRSIYQKLNVNRRQQALEAARQLNLL